MPFLTTNQIGPGTLYDFSSTEPVYLLEGVRYFSTSGNDAVFNMDVVGSTLIVGGSIMTSNGFGAGIELSEAGSQVIQVLRDGVVSTYNNAIRATSDVMLTLSNYGLIESTATAAISVYGSASLNLFNAGTIRTAAIDYVISGGLLADRIVNTGTLFGYVLLNAGDDYIDTHLGYVLGGTINGGQGNDTYIIRGDEEIIEQFGEGSDLVISYSDHTLGANFENLTLRGSARVGTGNALANVIEGGGGDDRLNGGGGNDTLNGLGGDNRLQGGTGDDMITAGDGDDVALGGAGNDTIILGGGTNRALGEAGDDIMLSGDDADYLDGGAGRDSVTFQTSYAGVNVNLTTGVASGGSADGDTVLRFEAAYGSTFADIFTGTGGDNELRGGGGNDQLFGAGGNDVLYGDAGADLLDGGSGVDWAMYDTGESGVTVNLTTGVGSGGVAQGDTFVSIENVQGTTYADIITGNVLANTLVGGYGDDTLLGAQGNDILEGGSGADTLRGGPGADVLVYADIGGIAGVWGVDRVEGFEDGIDRIDFRGETSVNSLTDLIITNQAGYVSIMGTSGGEIRLIGFTGTVDASDFIFS